MSSHPSDWCIENDFAAQKELYGGSDELLCSYRQRLKEKDEEIKKLKKRIEIYENIKKLGV